MKTAHKLAIVVAVQLLLLLTVVGFKQYTIWTGETVLLKVAPVDPRDPFRGDYFIVSYEISQVDHAAVPGYIEGERGYVELRKDSDGYWHAVRLTDDRRRTVSDSVLLKAEVEWQSSRGYQLKYGIEEIFIPEGSGDEIPWGRDVAVEVKVDRFGNAVARGLYVDGEPFAPTR